MVGLMKWNLWCCSFLFSVVDFGVMVGMFVKVVGWIGDGGGVKDYISVLSLFFVMVCMMWVLLIVVLILVWFWMMLGLVISCVILFLLNLEMSLGLKLWKILWN